MKQKYKENWKKLKLFYAAQDTLAEKMFWTVVPLTGIMGIFSVIGTIVERLGTQAIISGVSCILCSLIFAFVCYRDNKNCSQYYAVFVLVFNCLVFPLTFLANGGLHSGMPGYCVGTVLLSAFCVGRKRRIVVSCCSILAYLIVFILSLLYPQIVVPIREDFIDIDVIMSFVVSSASITVVISRAMEEVNEQRYKEVNNGLIDSLGTIIEFRSLETGNHVHRIKQYTSILLRKANECVPGADFSPEEIRMISSASVLHDIGKIAVPDSVLNKPGRLTMEEFQEIKRHPEAGCRMIETMKNFQNAEYYGYCYEICRHHHERYDGKGYPDGLKGNSIPLISQIAAVADVFEALTSERVYKKAFEPAVAVSIMEENEGQFSPEMIRCLKRALPELEKAIKLEPEEGIREELELARHGRGADFRTVK